MAAISSPALSPAFSTAQELMGRIDTMKTTAQELHSTLMTAVKQYDNENNIWALEGFPLFYKKARNNYKHVKNETKPWITKINGWNENLTDLKTNINKTKIDFTELKKSKKDPDEIKKRKADDEKVNPQAAQNLYDSYTQTNQLISTIESKLKRIGSTIEEIEERLAFIKQHPHSRRLTFIEMVRNGQSYPSILWNSGAKMMRYVTAATTSYVSTPSSRVDELSDHSDIEEDSPYSKSHTPPSTPPAASSWTDIPSDPQDTSIPPQNTPPFAPRTPSPSTQSASTLQDTTCPSSSSLPSIPEPSSSPSTPRTSSPSTQSASTLQDTTCPSSSSLTSIPPSSSPSSTPPTSSLQDISNSHRNAPPFAPRTPSPSTKIFAQNMTSPSLSSSSDSPTSSQTSVSIQAPEPSSITNAPPSSPTPDVPPIPDILLAIISNGNPSS